MAEQLTRIYPLESGTLEIVVKRQRRKSLALHILSPKEVEIRAPLKCAWSLIDEFVYLKEAWIRESITKLREMPVRPSPVFVHGEHHKFLGKDYQLEVCRGTPALVFPLGERIVVRAKNPEKRGEVERLFQDFLKSKAYGYFPDRIRECRQKFIGIDNGIADSAIDNPANMINRSNDDFCAPEKFHIRKMKARWGSCSSQGELCFNSLLMQKDEALIDLVIVHELCHLRHFNHNRAFYKLLGNVLPDWQEREKMLDGGSVD